MKAMILAAGFGTRLFPLTIDRTKPAIPFLGKPLIGYVAEYLAGFGITDVVVNLHHQPESVIQALGDGSSFGVNIEYTREVPDILGTAGALDNARDLLGQETFLVINGKIITDIDIKAALETHRSTGALATMVLKTNTMHERFTIVETDDGFVTGFGGFPSALSEGTDRRSAPILDEPLMFTGIQILEPQVFDFIPRGIYSDIVPVFYEPAIRKGEKIAAHIAQAKWSELSTLSRYLDISLAYMKGCDVHHGRNCRMSATATVKNSVLWDDVTIGDNATLDRVIVADGVNIVAGQDIQNAAIVRAESVRSCLEIPDKAQAGFFEGENYIVPLD